MTESRDGEQPKKFYVNVLWGKEGNTTQMFACSWRDGEIEKYLEEHRRDGVEYSTEKVETWLFKYPLWLLERWETGKSNTFEVFRDDEALVQRLRAIKPEEKASEDDDYPYTLYPIGEDTFVKEGMGELHHIHIDDHLLQPEILTPDSGLAWWELPYEFIANDCQVYRNERVEGFVLNWAAKRVGWGQLRFSRKPPELDEHGEPKEDVPFEMDTEHMSEEFVLACVTDFVKRCKRIG